MQILLSNTKLYIEGANRDILQYFSNNMRYRDPNAWFSPAYRNGFWDGYRKFFDLRSSSCDAGFLPQVIHLADKIHLTYVIIDTRPYIKRRAIPSWSEWHNYLESHLDIDPHPFVSKVQVNAVKKALRNYASDGIPWFRGVFSIATGGGKTSLMGLLCKVVKRPTLILLGRLDLLYQTKATLESLLEEQVGIVGDTVRDIQRVTILMSQTASREIKRNEQWFERFLNQQKMILLDEAHHLTSDSSQSYNEVLKRCKNAYFRYALSATPGKRGDTGDHALVGSFGQVLYSKRSREFRKVGALANVKCWIIDYPVETIKGKATRPTLKKQLIHGNFVRHEKIIESAHVFKQHKWPTLILVDSPLLHGESLQEAFRMLAGEEVVLINYKTPQKKRAEMLAQLEAGVIPYVLASTGVFSEGVNAPAIRALIRAEGSGSDIRSLQAVGRGLRRKGYPNVLYVVDFADKGHKKIKEDTKARLSVYEDEEYEISLIETPKEITFNF